MSGALWCSQSPLLYVLTSLLSLCSLQKPLKSCRSRRRQRLWLENQCLWSCCWVCGCLWTSLELTIVQWRLDACFGTLSASAGAKGCQVPHLEWNWPKRTLLLAPCFSLPSCTRWCLVSMALFSKRISLLCLLVEWDFDIRASWHLLWVQQNSCDHPLTQLWLHILPAKWTACNLQICV